ncbi:LMNB [Acanthosepion pharaonis]|uniref:LMNB n=1 Tax=Acanthosepion pharaonis TaxID=158019 RepID=A0A812EDI8_ACAPH|nr:LMNB [Sepia pharaonis]
MSRKVTTTTVTTDSPGVSGSSSSQTGYTSPRRTRAPSPARLTRIQEKEELQSLNDRLANYIDRVRYLEGENSRLMVQVKSSEETVSREVTNIKSLYESELGDARKLLDEMAKEKARLQIESGKYKAEADEWMNKYNRKDRELASAQKKLADLESLVNDLQAKLADAENAKKHLESQNATLHTDLATLERQLATARKQLEDETLLRVDLENRLQSFKEDMAFKSQVFERELNETRTRTTMSTEEVDGGLNSEYEDKLADALREMREEHDTHLQLVREEIENFYETKLSSLQTQLERNSNSSSVIREELKSAKRRIDDLLAEINSVKAQNAQYQKRITDLENQLERDSAEFQAQLAARDEEIKQLRESLAELTEESAELWSIKVKLDMEIAAYRKLLEGEEERLNLSASDTTPSKSVSRSVRSSKKRKLAAETAEETRSSSSNQGYASKALSKSSLSIEDVDTDGKYIKISNSGDKEISIGGWQLKHDAGEDETVFKFHRQAVLKPGASVTVWSAESDQTHNPPTDLVMKSQKWFVSDSMKTTLLNTGGEEMASREMSKSVLRSVESFRSSLSRDDGTESPERERITYSRRHLTPAQQRKGWLFW